jgi:hypothetical protein
MEVSDMDLYLVQSIIEEFIYVYGEQFDELVNCISKIKQLDDGILKIHWSGEGRDAFKTKINEWADSLKGIKTMMKTAKNAVTRLDEDTYRLISLAESIIIAGR